MDTQHLNYKIEKLPDTAKKEVEDFVEFLEQKYSDTQKKEKKVSNYGNAAGLIEMTDDFDEPLDDFKAYS